MKKTLLLAAASMCVVLSGSQAFAGDAEKGEDTFKRCKSCHAITAPDGTAIVKGGKTGPNLFGVIGRVVASEPGFKYGPSITAVGETGLVWDEEKLTAYVVDPGAWLTEQLDDNKAKTKMTFKLKKGGEDIAAYLATLTE